MQSEKSLGKMNVVLMVSDDHGREALGCYGNPVVKTPNLDALARDGIRLDNAFCTSASCSASRSAILTGLHNHTNGTYGHTHDFHHFSCFDGVKSLPARLNEAGYLTARVGKKHFAPDAVFPFRYNIPEERFGRDDVAMSEACRDLISGEEPFFLYWCSFNPHRSGQVLENHPCRPNVFGNPNYPFDGDAEQIYSDDEVIVPRFLSDTPEVRAELAQYYQSISRMDRGVGRLIQILKEEGKYENTLIIYLSDNGAAFPASKTTLYDPGMRLPCIVRCPDFSSHGTIGHSMISWTDITPTILDFCGVKPDPSEFFGTSFLEVLDGGMHENWREEIYASHSFHQITNYYPMRVLRTKRYKFIWNIAHPLTYSFASDLWESASWRAVRRDRPKTFGVRPVTAYMHRPRFELYDLMSDPDEILNLAEKKEFVSLVDQFCEKIRVFQKGTNDPWLHKWEYE
jgi:N-sulfoglucosamine sulfohydrolase